MTALLKANSLPEAWLGGMKHLMAKSPRRDFNVILDIQEPTVITKPYKAVYSVIDKFLRERNSSVETVSDTIFPAALYKRGGIDAFFKQYPDEIFPRIRENRSNWWGTYAQRLVRRTDHTGTSINPLERALNRLRAERHHTSAVKANAAYEVNLCDSFELDIALADAAQKGLTKRLSGPCLSHLSFKLVDQTHVGLVAFYRSHYYVARAFGNLVGLSQLLAFVAKEVGMTPAFLTCISSYAQIDTEHWTIGDVQTLITKSESALNVS